MRVEQRVEVENRRHLAADLGQRLERVDVLALGPEQARVLDRHGDVRGELAQQRLVLRVNAPSASLSRFSAPITRPLRRIGTASCDSMLRSGPM